MNETLRMIEVDRIGNVAKGFGWSLESTKSEGETLTIELKKTIPSSTTVQPEVVKSA
jgi:hypothetical protein